ncbi:MAG: VIT domain-containing protein [Polyangia bacterium]
MKRASLLCLACALIAAKCEDPPPEPATPLDARVELAAGDVHLVGRDGAERLVSGAMLPENAELELGEGARALIKLGSGAAIFLRGGSRALVSCDAVELKAGELWAELPRDEENLGHIAAGEATVTAAGSGLDVAFDGETTTVYVARGLAVVSSPGGRAEVQSGERARVERKSEPRVEPVSFWEDWTGGMADRGLLACGGGRAAGRLYGIDRDRPGSPPGELQIVSQKVRTFIRDGVAQTTVDQVFFNPDSSEVEGWYWFTVPEGAAVERFAWEVDGRLIEAQMIERKTAAAEYEAAVRSRTRDPALLEWVDGRSFRARIYPVPATGQRRLLLTYTELLPLSDGVYRYVYPMGGEDEVRIQEFGLDVDLGDEGEKLEVATLQDARIDDEGRHVTMRRSGFVPRSDFLLEIRPHEPVEPLRAMRFSAGGERADFAMLRYSPEVDWGDEKDISGDVVIVLDTSAGGGESVRQVSQDAVSAILRALAPGDHFAIAAADLTTRVVYPADGLAPAGGEQVGAAMEAISEVSSSGATDLGEIWGTALELVHECEQPAVVYVGDGRATVGELSATELSERLRRSLSDSRARLFTIAVGADADLPLLKRLARVGGGRMFRVDRPEQVVQETLRFVGRVKTPTITDLEIDAGGGLDQKFSSAASKVSEGEEVLIAARTHHALPDEIRITGRLDGEPFEKSYEPEVTSGPENGYLPSVWARMYLERLMGDGVEENRGRIISLGLDHSLMTPLTSFLALEDPQAYRTRGIPIRSRFRFGALEGERGSALASAAAAPALGLFGCSEMSMEAPAGDEEMAKQAEMSEQPRSHSSPAAPPPPAAGPARQAGEARGAAKPGDVSGVLGTPSASAEESEPARDEATVAREKESLAADKKRRRAPGKPVASQKREAEILDGLGAESGGLGLRGSGRGGGGGSGAGYGSSVNALITGALSKGALGSLGTAGPGADEGEKDELRIAVDNPYDDGRDKPMFRMRACSDASRRPLYQRRHLWSRRLARADDASQYLRIFTEAGERCELPSWRARRVLLNLIEGRVSDGDQVRALLAVFGRYPGARRHLRRRIVRHALDPDRTMGLWFGQGVDWLVVQRGLAAIEDPERRIENLRKILEKHPDDPTGRSLLVQELLETERVEEARAEASRLKREGLAGPTVLRVLCDLQAEAGMEDEARRTCSELVEFNRDDPLARSRLGDLFLRHGWYDAAYRQYRTLVEQLGDEPAALLRLAAAAAGTGKVDEALRIERRVASGEGEIGPDDPRRWARIHSAVKLAGMLAEARADGDEQRAEAMERSLKRTRAFPEPGSLVVLVWEDLSAPLEISAEVEGEEIPVGERVLAPQVGLAALDVGRDPPSELELAIRLAGETLRRAVPYTLLTLRFDGESYGVEETKGSLQPREEETTVTI